LKGFYIEFQGFQALREPAIVFQDSLLEFLYLYSLPSPDYEYTLIAGHYSGMTSWEFSTKLKSNGTPCERVSPGLCVGQPEEIASA
jgi:hypothetical protein